MILKGGKEAAHSNAILVEVIREALQTVPEVPVDCVQLISSREEVSTLLALGTLPPGLLSLSRKAGNNLAHVLPKTQGACCSMGRERIQRT